MSLLMKVEEESGKSWFKTQHSINEDHGIQSHHFMANRWGNNGNSDRLFSWAPKSLRMVTEATKLRHLLLGRTAMTNLGYSKRRDISLPTKVCLVKDMIFPVVMYRCESWTVKKAECWRTDAFELWYWRRLFRVLWTARRLNQSILREINSEYSFEGLMLKLQYTVAEKL